MHSNKNVLATQLTVALLSITLWGSGCGAPEVTDQTIPAAERDA